MRRLNSDPITSNFTENKKDGNKENDRILMLSPLKRDLAGKTTVGTPLRAKTPFESHDGNSQDSGFAQDDSQHSFRYLKK